MRYPIQAQKTVQLKDSYLKKDHFNVVGEEHDKSGQRRDEEQQYAKCHSGSDKFYLENDLREEPLTDYEKRQKKEDPSSFRDTRKPADSYRLQLFGIVKDMQEHIKSLFLLAAQAQTSTEPNQGDFLDEFVNSFMLELTAAFDYLILALTQRIEDFDQNQTEFREEERGYFNHGVIQGKIRSLAKVFYDVYENPYKVAFNAGYTNFTKLTELDSYLLLGALGKMPNSLKITINQEMM